MTNQEIIEAYRRFSVSGSGKALDFVSELTGLPPEEIVKKPKVSINVGVVFKKTDVWFLATDAIKERVHGLKSVFGTSAHDNVVKFEMVVNDPGRETLIDLFDVIESFDDIVVSSVIVKNIDSDYRVYVYERGLGFVSMPVAKKGRANEV